MTLSAIFISSFMVALSGALMPGPLLTVTIAQTAKKGFVSSVLLVAGHVTLELIVVIFLLSGLGHLLRIKPITGGIAIIGGIMLLFMGWSMFHDARRGALDLPSTKTANQETQSTGSMLNSMLTGMVVSITNPYWVIWWATIGLAGITFFAGLRQNMLWALGAFYIGHSMGDIIWYLIVGAAVASGRRLLSTNIYRAIVQICALFLIFLGGSFIYLVATGNLWKIQMATDWAKSW
ncbi:MAG: LysE family transporter [Armatimonadota bacterium]|nr:LysE family transporter [Armatimonadota bacterium]